MSFSLYFACYLQFLCHFSMKVGLQMPADSDALGVQIGEYQITSDNVLGDAEWEFFIEHLELEKSVLEVF